MESLTWVAASWDQAAVPVMLEEGRCSHICCMLLGSLRRPSANQSVPLDGLVLSHEGASSSARSDIAGANGDCRVKAAHVYDRGGLITLAWQ